MKTVRPEYAADLALAERFKRETLLARQVTHPNVCRVYDLASLGRASGGAPILCLTMELLTGRTLSQTLRESGHWTFDRALLHLRMQTSELAQRTSILTNDPARQIVSSRNLALQQS